MAALLEVSDLVKRFPVPKGLAFWRPAAQVKAVDGVSFSIEEGTTFGLVGKSGCGKTTLSRMILLLRIRPAATFASPAATLAAAPSKPAIAARCRRCSRTPTAPLIRE